MSAAIQDLKQLPVSERIQIVEDLWDSIADDPSAIGSAGRCRISYPSSLSCTGTAIPEDGNPGSEPQRIAESAAHFIGAW